jgi:predicted carbohydrate-binding protein with CBM5 and CBM33 domain
VTISRVNKCSAGIALNTNCGNIMHDFPGVEGNKGFPSALNSPADGKIASAGHADGARPDFAEIDVQTATRWHKTSVEAGTIQFEWNFTTNHNSTGWQYFITKAGWNANVPLTRAAFETTTPFCTVNMPSFGAQPPMGGVAHTCILPSRATGSYHVVLAVWTIADTYRAFYNVIDVKYGSTMPTAPVAPIDPVPRPVPVPVPVPTMVVVPTPVSATNVCASGQGLAAVDQCTAFVYCVNGQVLANSRTPCAAGTLFSNAVQVCDWKANVVCA